MDACCFCFTCSLHSRFGLPGLPTLAESLWLPCTAVNFSKWRRNPSTLAFTKEPWEAGLEELSVAAAQYRACTTPQTHSARGVFACRKPGIPANTLGEITALYRNSLKLPHSLCDKFWRRDNTSWVIMKSLWNGSIMLVINTSQPLYSFLLRK